MPVVFDSEKRVFKLDTPSSSYAMKISPTGYLLHLYYGAYVPDTDLDYLRMRQRNAAFSACVASAEEGGLSLDTAQLEYPVNGSGDFRSVALSVRGANGSSVTDIRYRSHRIYPGKPKLEGLPATYTNDDSEAETLEIVCVDELTGAEITLIYAAFSKLDVITRSVRIANTSDKPFSIERVHSAAVDFTEMDFDMLHLQGRWAKERTLVTRHLEFGLQGIHSRRLVEPQQQSLYRSGAGRLYGGERRGLRVLVCVFRQLCG